MGTVVINFEDLFATTRASNASFFDSNGLLTTVANNIKRLPFDVTAPTLSRLGVLVEESGTNNLQNSRFVQQVAGTVNNFNLAAGSTVSVAVGVPKIDGADGVTMCIDNVATNALVSQNFTIPTEDQTKNAVISCYMAQAPLLNANTGQLPALFATLTGTASTTENGVVDLGRGLIRRAANQQATNFISNGIEKGPIVNGLQYYRVWMAFSLANVTTFGSSIRPGFLSSTTLSTAALFDGNGNSSAASTGQVYVDQIQLEIGTGITVPTSPIVTDVGNIATRASEIFTSSGATFTENFSTESGSIIVDAIARNQSATVNRFLFSISDGTTANSIVAFRNTSGNAIVRITTGSVVQANFDLGSWPSGQRRKIGLTFTQNSFKAAFNGVVGSAVTGTLPTGLNTLRIGSSESGSNQWHNIISKFDYVSEIYSDSALMAQTS